MAESKLNPREKARQEEMKKNRKVRSRYIMIGVVILLMAALVIFVNSRLFTDGMAALKVNDKKFSVADVNYEYRKQYMQFTQNYDGYLQMFFDESQPLSEQECLIDPECDTWDDYFKKAAESSLTQRAVLYDAAVKAGYEITEDEIAQIDSVLSTYEMYAGYLGYSNLSGYLAASFGAGNNETTVRRNMTQEIIVDRYMQDLYDSYIYTDAEKDAYYEDNADTLDKVNFLYAYLSGDDAQTKAAEILETMDGTDEEAFRAAVTAVTNSEPTRTSNSVSSFLSQYGESITKDDLAPGKTFVSDGETASYAVYIIGLDDNRYHTVSVRHILIKASDEDDDGVYSEEEIETAHNAIKDVEAEWLAGEATEESFATLATLRTEDTGSEETGGLYEGIFKGQMVPEFEAFCFGGHEKGDTGIVFHDGDNYTGYHLIYFVGEDEELYSRELADDQMRSEAYNEALSELVGDLEPVRTFMWRYVMKG